MKKPFLTAEWRKLILVNYVIDPAILKKYLPYKTELDLWEGKCYVSLVGFMFLNTKVKGCKLPGHINFEEVNLRYYIKHHNGDEVRRGVGFIKEIVPKPLIASIARTVYKEPYQSLPMKHSWSEENELNIEYSWKLNDNWNSVSVKAEISPFSFNEKSEADFITEHYWGYTKINNVKTNEFEVKHPSWKIYNVLDSIINVDFESSYGTDFEFLNHQQPVSVMLAEGSKISVGNKRVI
ncbi:MAG: YqjF family protein [Flavobacteriales bacterium]|jgi:uncharacterized protein YqjF (DUF2071 family)|tara:strand:- start:155 stop:865 length:711 start_codon:yes stop_codon:yes gene_type:complete